MNIENALKIAGINFNGVCVQDAQRIDLIREVGVTLSWQASRTSLENHKKIIIVGNDKVGEEHEATFCKNQPQRRERGKFFIAEIAKIVNMNEYLIETKGYGDEAIRKHHCNGKYPILPDKQGCYWDKRRFAIYFKNPTEIMYFPNLTGGHNITFWRNSVKYI